jgi:hypothetical protein
VSSERRGGYKRRWPKLTAFRAGFLLGLATLVAGAWFLNHWLTPAHSSGFNVDVASAGADVSRGGGVVLVIRDKRGSLTQTCRGACDDLRYQAHDDETDYEVRVLDASGACVACDRPRGIMGGYGGWSHRWVIAGQRPLKIVVSDRIGSLSWGAAGEVRAK